MSVLIVVNNPSRWPLDIPGAPVVAARSYLTEPHFAELRGGRVFNLCKSYRYQSTGYYVSLLAMARGHKPMPSINTIQDMKFTTVVRLASDELDQLIQRSLKPIRSDAFVLSIYFGRNVAHRYDTLAGRLFKLFPAPLLRAEFVREEGEWRLRTVGPMAGNDVPESHQPFLIEAATAFFQQKHVPRARRTTSQYDLAILFDPNERFAPSTDSTIRKFERAARRFRMDTEVIGRDDFARLAEFDALFIRMTTQLNHYTYRFARRAAAEGLVVVDDPDSITKCTNKVYLAELLVRHGIAAPKTVIVHRDNRDSVLQEIGLPCILKQPDSFFSQGVVKVDTEDELHAALDKLLDDSDLVIAQEFMPTAYDWRVGVLDRRPLFVAKYHMAREHWQIAKTDAGGDTRYGKVEAVPMSDVPRGVISTAVRAANLIGDGLYGVDLKHVGSKSIVIEINDNPNIDAGQEDRILGDTIYENIMQYFLTRIHARRNGTTRYR